MKVYGKMEGDILNLSIKTKEKDKSGEIVEVEVQVMQHPRWYVLYILSCFETRNESYIREYYLFTLLEELAVITIQLTDAKPIYQRGAMFNNFVNQMLNQIVF